MIAACREDAGIWIALAGQKWSLGSVTVGVAHGYYGSGFQPETSNTALYHSKGRRWDKWMVTASVRERTCNFS